jgi:hypothetical protein
VIVAEDTVLVTGLKGPLEEGWQQKVQAFATRILARPPAERSAATTTGGAAA